MIIMVEFIAGYVSSGADPTYSSAELSLDYRHQPEVYVYSQHLAGRIDEVLGIRRESDFLVIAGTLIIVFMRKSRELVAFDAYTNKKQWVTESSLMLPETSGAGKICLINELREKEVDLAIDPVYSYNDKESLLEISLCQESPEEIDYYHVSDRLIVGVCRGALTSLTVQSLRMI